MLKKIILVLLSLAAIGGGVGYYMWNKPLESMASQKADLGIPATTLYTEYNADENAANTKYLGKIVSVSGKVKSSRTVESAVKVEIEAGDGVVLCELDVNTKHPRTEFTAGEAITLKGECAGLDIDGTVMLSRCAENK